MMLRKTAAAFAFVAGAVMMFPAHAADPAVFDAATGRLRFPILQIDGNLKFRDVVIQLVSPGQLRLNDASVGADISFTSAGNVLRIPQLSFGGAVYPAVSLTTPAFSLVSFGDVVIDAGSPSNATLDVRVTAQGTPVPLITINNVPRPATQAAFCNDPSLQQAVLENAGAAQATWTMSTCTFNGSTGRMTGTLTITTPVAAAIPIVATFTYR
ncbi:hypothetical protein [Acidovorax sp. A1169]|uniref:hypothetical protein n=1 Tax=Acidovorax sp. A1169 TaxID=3059524 RepID=UPI002737A971|nr:hypothetical protein [Acidovorax sp. A1169]MDP4073190.1 hypothetical protein [Acidovorax sp. A1169]